METARNGFLFSSSIRKEMNELALRGLSLRGLTFSVQIFIRLFAAHLALSILLYYAASKILEF